MTDRNQLRTGDICRVRVGDKGSVGFHRLQGKGILLVVCLREGHGYKIDGQPQLFADVIDLNGCGESVWLDELEALP